MNVFANTSSGCAPVLSDAVIPANAASVTLAKRHSGRVIPAQAGIQWPEPASMPIRRPGRIPAASVSAGGAVSRHRLHAAQALA
jgi:hypothetical protein